MWQAVVNMVEQMAGEAAATIVGWAWVWIPLMVVVLLIRRSRWFKRVTR